MQKHLHTNEAFTFDINSRIQKPNNKQDNQKLTFIFSKNYVTVTVTVTVKYEQQSFTLKQQKT